jgi:RNA polymerase sigma factor (sigma-70 family)
VTGSVLDGEDVVQDALFQAYRKLDTFDDARPLAPWLFRIAHNRCIDYLRRREVREDAEAGAEEARLDRPRRSARPGACWVERLWREDAVTPQDPTSDSSSTELANALQSVVLIAERLEQQAASVSLDANDVIKGFRRVTPALNAVRAADHGSE